MAGMIFQTSSRSIHGYLLFLHINNSKISVSSGRWGKACCFRQYPFIFPVFPAYIPTERIDMYIHIRQQLTMYKEMPQEPPWNHPYNTDVFSLSPAWSHPAQHGNQERACVSSVFPLRPRKYTSHPLHGFPSIYYRILQIQARHFPQKHRRPVYPGYPPGLSLKGRYPLVARQK